jgi:hypothetical protein
MDNNTLIAGVSLAVSLAGIVLGVINHKRIVSTCCRYEIEASLDIDNTTPLAKNEVNPPRERLPPRERNFSRHIIFPPGADEP